MSRFYVACDLGTETGRIVLGTLNKDQLTISEVRRFPNIPVRDKECLQWNIPQLYENVVEGLRTVGAYEEAVESISFSSWSGDYLLFEPDGSLMTPAFHHHDTRVGTLKKGMLAGFPAEVLYEETGMQRTPTSTFFQLVAESPRRLKRAAHLLPIADGFNFLFSGVSHVERSSAGCTQLYNPVTHSWSQRLVSGLHLPGTLLPSLVDSATPLGPLRPEIARDVRLDDARIVASCSDRFAAAVAGLPLAANEDWAFFEPGKSTLLGTQLGAPLISDASRSMGFSNGVGYGGAVYCHRQANGFSILDECQQYWKKADREIDAELLSHLAGSAPPFESLIDPADARFSTPGDMPLKIQAFCKETGQPVPRRPGPIFRCILESLALSYRKSLQELELFTGLRFSRLFVLGQTEHPLLNHFTANAVRIPTVVMGEDAAAIGNTVLQALSLRHLESIEQGRELIRRSFKHESIVPYANAWDAAYDRLVALSVTAEG